MHAPVAPPPPLGSATAQYVIDLQITAWNKHVLGVPSFKLENGQISHPVHYTCNLFLIALIVQITYRLYTSNLCMFFLLAPVYIVYQALPSYNIFVLGIC